MHQQTALVPLRTVVRLWWGPSGFDPTPTRCIGTSRPPPSHWELATTADCGATDIASRFHTRISHKSKSFQFQTLHSLRLERFWRGGGGRGGNEVDWTVVAEISRLEARGSDSSQSILCKAIFLLQSGNEGTFDSPGGEAMGLNFCVRSIPLWIFWKGESGACKAWLRVISVCSGVHVIYVRPKKNC